MEERVQGAEVMATPHACPVCQGAGTVSKPPHVAGDQEQWSGCDTAMSRCNPCGGSGIVWEPDYGISPPLADNTGITPRWRRETGN
jgi:hypothetical protein